MKRAGRKRILSFILVIIMLTSLCGFNVLAEDSPGDPPNAVESQDPTPANPSPSEPVVPSPSEPVAPSPSEPVAPSPSESATPSPSESVTPSPSESATPSPEPAKLVFQKLSQTMSDGITVIVSGNLPDGIELRVIPMDVSLDDLEVLCAYDISLWLNNEEYSITEAVMVSFLDVEISEADNIEAFHIDDGKVDQIGVTAAADTNVATMTAESFSTYVVAKKPNSKGSANITVKYGSDPIILKTVYLLDSSGNVIDKEITDFLGIAYFSNIPAGSYSAIVGYNENSWGTYYAYTGSASVEIKANERTKASIALTRTTGFDGGIAYDYAVRNGCKFDHVDVRTKGTITVDNQINGVSTGTKTYNIVVSKPKVKIDNGPWDTTPDSTSSWEFRFSKCISVPPTSTVYISCTITATNAADPNDKYTGTLDISYSGRAAFKKAIEDCEAKQGLDFTINESEIINALFYSYSYSWSAAASENYILASGDLGSASLPTGGSNLGNNTPVTVDTTYTQGKQVSGYKNGVPGTWTFSGWDHGNFNITADTTIWGTWTFIPTPTYKIIYDANGGSGEPAAETDKPNGTYTLTTTGPSTAPSGSYTFAGWSTTKNDASTKVTSVTIKGANVTVYALWDTETPPTPTYYSIIYDANGGSGEPPSENNKPNGTYTLTTTGPSTAPSGSYTFAGWSTTKDDSTTKVTRITINGASVTVYALWSKVPTYSIIYDANGGTGGPGEDSGKPNGTYTLSTTGPSKSSYSFAGWSTAKDDSTTKVTSVTINGANVTVYALWSYDQPFIGGDIYYGPGLPATSPTPSPTPSPSEIPEESPPLAPSPSIIPEEGVPGAIAPVISSETPQTGDDSNILLMAILATLSAIGLGAVGVAVRKKKHNK